ncbi:hypothetical protein Ancab_014348, partial [Ancistrocladus abbreviatus]
DEDEEAKEFLEAEAQIWHHMFSFRKINELSIALPNLVHPQKAKFLGSLIRILINYGRILEQTFMTENNEQAE